VSVDIQGFPVSRVRCQGLLPNQQRYMTYSKGKWSYWAGIGTISFLIGGSIPANISVAGAFQMPET